MPEFQFQGVDHVNITAPEELMDDVCRWYEDILGLRRLPKPETVSDSGCWFAAGRQEVHVSVDPHNPPHRAHFGLVTGDFASVVEALRRAGCHLEQARVIPGRHRFYTRDPAGNRIEITTIDEDVASVEREEV